MKLLVIVWVAPQDPYPQLYLLGASSTWMKGEIEGVDVISGSGNPLNSFRRIKVDLREQLRFSGSSTSKVGTVNYEGSLQRKFDQFIEYAHGPLERFSNKFTKLMAEVTLRLARQLSMYWERALPSLIKNRRRARCSFFENHIMINRLSTISNSSALTLDVLNWFVEESDYDGVLITTTGAYVDLGAFRAFASSIPDISVIASARPPGAKRKSEMSGFGMYYSKKVARGILSDCNLDHSLPNDLALSKWAEANVMRIEEIPTEWDVASKINSDRSAPDNTDRIVLYRCTQHWDRNLETDLMHQVHASMKGQTLPKITNGIVDDAETEVSH